MKIATPILLIILTVCMVDGCSGTEEISQTSIASEDPEFRRINDLCEQEAQARCWEPADSSPLYINEILENRKQSKCKKEWISSCFEKQPSFGVEKTVQHALATKRSTRKPKSSSLHLPILPGVERRKDIFHCFEHTHCFKCIFVCFTRNTQHNICPEFGW